MNNSAIAPPKKEKKVATQKNIMGLLFTEDERAILRETAQVYFNRTEGIINPDAAIIWIGKAAHLGTGNDVQRFLTPKIDAENAKRTKYAIYESHWN